MKKQISSRMKRFEEKRLRTRLLLVSVGSLALVIIFAVFGLRLLIGLSVLIDQARGTDTQTTQRALVIPPFLDPLPLATGSGRLVVTGRGQQGSTVVLFINEQESKKTQIGEDGTFIISSLSLSEGNYTIRAKTEDTNGKLSEFSNAVRTTIKRRPPALEITKPNDGDVLSGADNLVKVEGRTEEDVDIRINDRFVVVKQDGFFTYDYPLDEGDNTLTIKAIDRAGNSTQQIKKVTYRK
jgi:hypothetical protein